MTILHISDTHGLHCQLNHLPAADIIVHSGDITTKGTEEEVFDFINWFCDLSYKYKIFIAGNHDTILSGVTLDGLDDNCYYLDGSSVVIDELKFHGIPLFINELQDGTLKLKIEQIPLGTNVLITHLPPYGIFDYSDDMHFGNFHLLQKVSEVNPKLYLFGHVHPQNGIQTISYTTFSNASLLSSDERSLNDTDFKLLTL